MAGVVLGQKMVLLKATEIYRYDCDKVNNDRDISNQIFVYSMIIKVRPSGLFPPDIASPTGSFMEQTLACSKAVLQAAQSTYALKIFKSYGLPLASRTLV